MRTSLFEIFKIGIGPSSSHTVGPMRAALDFVRRIIAEGRLERVTRVQCELFGSLALTGEGHGTDRAVLLGLSGEDPETVEPDRVGEIIRDIRACRRLFLGKQKNVPFRERRDLLFHKKITLSGHPNGMRFRAFGKAGNEIKTEIYYSIGGGFIQRQEEMTTAASDAASIDLPYPFTSAMELLRLGSAHSLKIWEIVLENEKARHTEEEIRAHIARVWMTMQECVNRGLRTDGILPGGLNVRRRAAKLAKRLEEERGKDALNTMDWVNAFAMAVNEENACGGRVVTAPTNGAAGVIPAVAHFYQLFANQPSGEGIFRFFLTAAAIGILYKENASISGAEVGCQGEVGVACSMGAGALTAALGGTNEQVEYAAEIGMEHNLGMTCDPIKGLVQIPCIERNAMGAVKAINASRIAMRESGEHKVSLDQVIETMYRTGLDMQSRYKETSLAGLATLNIVEC